MDLSTQRSLYLTHNGAQVLKTRDVKTGEAQTASRDFVNPRGPMSDTTIGLDVVFVGDFFLTDWDPMVSGQIIATSAEVTPNRGLVRELPQNALNSGLGIIVICPDGIHHLTWPMWPTGLKNVWG